MSTEYKELRRLAEEILHELRCIRRELQPQRTATQIRFTEITMNPTEAGQTQVFTGTLSPNGAVYPAGTTFTVTSNDPAITPTVDPTGTVVTVTYPQGWTESTTTALAFQYASSVFVPVPSTSPTQVTATITPSAPPQPPTPTPVAINFQQTT